MKVAFALPFLQRGYGIEHRVLSLAECLPSDVERAVLCLVLDAPPPRSSTVVTFPAPIGRRLAACGGRSWVRHVLQTRFHHHLGSDWIVDAQYHPMTELRPRGASVVTWYSVTPATYADSGAEARRWESHRRAMINAARRADLVLCISEAVADEMQRELNHGPRVEVLYIGFDPARSGRAARKEGRRILSVGRFAAHKCHEDTVAAFRLVRDALPKRDVELILCGTLPANRKYFDTLHIFAAAMGLQPGKDVHFVPSASDRMISALMSHSDVFVSASRWEGFGMPLVEAQGSGLPCVAYSVWSHPEVVADQGLLAREGDVEGLAERIIALLERESAWQAASETALRFVQERFRWDRIAARYVELLSGL